MTSVLVVDDSGFVRDVVGNALADRGYEVGTASDGREAVRLVEQCDPDVVTMDVEMPGMDGIEATERIMASHPTPVVVVSAHTQRGAEATLKALARGAIDVVTKPDGDDGDAETLVDRIDEKVSRVADADVSGRTPRTPPGSSGASGTGQSPDGGDEDGDGSAPGFTAATPSDPIAADLEPPDPPLAAGAGDGAARTDGATTLGLGTDADSGWPAADRSTDPVAVPSFDAPDREAFAPTVVIGASTGGPDVVETVMAGLPAALEARVLVVQHMPETFTGRLAVHLDGVSEYDVSEAADGDRVGPGEAVVAKGDYHLRVTEAVGGRLRVGLDRGERVHSVRPAVDVTMQSAAECASRPLVGVVLTGMGRDGAAGIAAIDEAGGVTIAQDRETSSVPGMPEQAVATGHVSTEVPPAEIPAAICEALRERDGGNTHA